VDGDWGDREGKRDGNWRGWEAKRDKERERWWVAGRRKVTLLSFASREQCQVLLPSTTVHQLWTFFAGFSRIKFGTCWKQRQTATQLGVGDKNMHPRERPWTDVTVVDMKVFVGILFYMGISKLPELEMYWSQTYLLLAQPISELMSFNCFQQILRFLHLNDSDQQVSHGQPGYDALFKVRKLLDLIIPRLMLEYHVHEELAVDEAMIPFKGRLDFKQYMKDKPTKWGIKVFVLVDLRNGYVKCIQIYTGKNSELSKNEVGLTSSVVLELLEGLEQTHPKVFTD